MTLSGPDLMAFIALRRVYAGGLANLAGCWLDFGRPVPGYLTSPLDDLTQSGLVTLADPESMTGLARPARLTDTGQARYGALLARHGAAPVARAEREMPGPESGAAPAEDDRPSGYYLGECGHPVAGGPVWRIGECRECEATGATS